MGEIKQGFRRPSRNTACGHGGNQRQIEVGKGEPGADRLQEQTGDQTVKTQLRNHGNQICRGGHPGQDAGEHRPGDAAEEAVAPAADHAAQEDGDMYGKEELSGAEGVEGQGQDIAQGDTQGADGGALHGRHRFHNTTSLYNIVQKNARAVKPPGEN